MDKEKFTKIHFVLGIYSIIFILFIAIVPISFDTEFLTDIFELIFGFSVFFIPAMVVISGVAFFADHLNKINVKNRNERIILLMTILNLLVPIGFFIYILTRF